MDRKNEEIKEEEWVRRPRDLRNKKGRGEELEKKKETEIHGRLRKIKRQRKKEKVEWKDGGN